MKPTRLLAPIALAAALLAPAAASAITVKNCSGIPVRVHVYNNDDAALTVARAGGKIEAGSQRAWGAGGGRVLVKVFRTGIFDQLVVTRGNLGARSGYHVALDSNGNWAVRNNAGGC